MNKDNCRDIGSLSSSSEYVNPALQEAAAAGFSVAHPGTSSNSLDSIAMSELIAWFGEDSGTKVSPGCLLDVVVTLAGGQFLSTLGLGSRLLAEFGSIGGVLAADFGRLSSWLQRDGHPKWFIEQLHLRLKANAGLMKRVLLEDIPDRPVVSSWTALLDYLKVTMGYESIEQFRVLFLDKKNTLIKDEMQQRGTVDHTPLYPREIAKRSLELGASAVIMVHNHPSGDPSPSRADIEMTKQVEAALAPLRIALHDHLIVGSKGHLSFKSEGLL